jgi:hypothetical protein
VIKTRHLDKGNERLQRNLAGKVASPCNQASAVSRRCAVG